MIKQTSVIIIVIGYDDDYNIARGTTCVHETTAREIMSVKKKNNSACDFVEFTIVTIVVSRSF